MHPSLRRTVLLLAALFAITGHFSGQSAPASRPAAAPALYLAGPRPLEARYLGPEAPARAIEAGQAKPLSLAQADLDGDGVADLIAGYRLGNAGVLAIHRGNLDAFAPQSRQSFLAIARGDFPSAFLPEAAVLPVPAAPDFLAAGQFTSSERPELILAARGGRAAYVLKGTGAGGWRLAQTLEVPGEITVLVAGRILSDTGFSQVFVGVGGGGAPKLLAYSGSRSGLSPAASWAVGASPTQIEFGGLDGNAFPGAAVLAGGRVLVLRGRDLQRALRSPGDAAALQEIGSPDKVAAIALGRFVHDRDPRPQMALLRRDGGVQILAHEGFDARPYGEEELRALGKRRFTREISRGEGFAAARTAAAAAATTTTALTAWKEIERFAGIASMDPAGPGPLFFRTRISSNSADDVMVLDRARGSVAVLEHSNASGQASGSAGFVLRRRESVASAAAALPMRINVDGRPGVVLLAAGSPSPSVMMPLPDPTFVVNTTADTITANGCAPGNPNTCSLREAVIEANASAGADTIMVPAGTYQLTIPPNIASDPHDASAGDLDITDGVSIVGANPATTIVEAGPSASSGIDKIFSINPLGMGPGFDTSLSNLTIRFGKNPFPAGSGDEFGGALDWSAGSDGAGNLTITNCIITDNATTDGDGGGLALSNPGGSGMVTINNTTIQNNSAQTSTTGVPGIGGGVLAGTFTSLVMSNSLVAANQAPQSGGSGGGGGVSLGAFSHSTFHHCTISGNQTGSNGGGIFTNQGLTIDQGTVVSGNTAGHNGGGLWNDLTEDFTSISNATITGNSAAGTGGGIQVDASAPQALSIHFSRIVNNTAAAGSGLDNIGGQVDATDNWWGCNQGPGFAPCDLYSVSAVGSDSFDPWIVLTHTANPTTIFVGGSTTLTASFLQDNHGAPIAAGNLAVLIGLPIAFNNAVDGSLSGAQAAIQPSGTATATFTGTAAGNGSADATVDSGTATAAITVLAPPSISKSFGAATVPLNGSTSLGFTLTNPAQNTMALTGLAFTDNLPAGLAVATPNGLAGSCPGGTITAAAGSGSVTLSGATLSPGASCTFSVNVTGTSSGVKNNSVTVSAANGGGSNGNTSMASVSVVAPPTITKAFGAASVQSNGTTSLSFTINNPNGSSALTGVGFTDTLPSGLVVSTPNGLTGGCGGVIAAAAGSGSISLTGGTLPASGTCTFSVNVTGTGNGFQANTTGPVTSAEGGAGAASNTATLAVGVLAVPMLGPAGLAAVVLLLAIGGSLLLPRVRPGS